MALYLPISSKISSQESFKIPTAIQKDGYTLYLIKICVPPYTWTCQHRYSEFRELHEKLVTSCGVEKSLLPPKKIFGNNKDQFILKRQAELEVYLQTVVHHLALLPDPLAIFLDFQKYEVRCIIDKLSETLFFQGDEILANHSEFTMSPLQLHALSERLKLPEPTCASGDKKRDLGHALAFISQLKNLTIKGSIDAYGNSNIIPNNLPYDLTPFKSLIKLTVIESTLKGNLKDLSSLRNTVNTITVRNSLEDLSSILLGDVTHWSPMDSTSYWPWWLNIVEVDFNHNKISSIDPCVKLLSSLETLDLSNNLISNVENLESLPHLSKLNLSNNHICHLDALHTRLGNIKTLLISGNYISSLRGLSRLYSLVTLDLSQNQISQVKEIEHLKSLPCLEVLNLSSNPVTSVLDYRPNVLLAFVPRAAEILLDGQKVTQKELDKVSVLQALQAAREGRVLRHSSFYDSANPRTDTTTNTEVLYARESGCGQPDISECLVQFDPHTEEFRQQVAALRRLGGNDWLRLLNQLQKECQKVELDPSKSKQSKALENSLPKNTEDMNEEFTNEPEIPCETNGRTSCFFLDRDSSGNILLPDWLFSINVSIFKFRSQILKVINSEESNSNNIVCETPLWCTWVLTIRGDDQNFRRYPACFLLTSNNMYLLELLNLDCLETEGYRNQPEAIVNLETSLQANNVKHAVIGPYNNYLEILYGHTDGTRKIVVWTDGIHMQSLISKLRSHYGFQIESKYTLEEMYDLIQHTATMFDRLNGSFISGYLGPRLKVLVCEAVCRMQIEEQLEVARGWMRQKNAIAFLVVTQNSVLLLEESLVLSFKGTTSPFKMIQSIEISSCVKEIRMKDSGASHSCCCHKQNLDGQSVQLTKTKNCCFLHELYTCGYWLFIDFEGNLPLKVRFLSREARSRFLEAFLASRNQKP